MQNADAAGTAAVPKETLAVVRGTFVLAIRWKTLVLCAPDRLRRRGSLMRRYDGRVGMCWHRGTGRIAQRVKVAGEEQEDGIVIADKVGWNRRSHGSEGCLQDAVDVVS